MRTFHALAVLLLVISITNAYPQGALLPVPPDKPAIGMRNPAISPDGSTICFSYLGDLWTVPSTGGVATRLTIFPALNSYPRWSPDGKWIAFASDRDGGYQIYIIPAEGGEVRQITYDTVGNFPNAWSPDGTKILFTSMRDTRFSQQYEIDVRTGVVKTLTHDDMFTRYGVYSPDGKTIAYDRCGLIAYWWRPLYKGSANFDIYTKNLETGDIHRVTDYIGNDMWPMYGATGKHIYYVTDQLTPGVDNLVKIPSDGGKPELVTDWKSDVIRYPDISRNGKVIVYERKGHIYTVSTSGGPSKLVPIIIRTDDRVNNIVHLNLTNNATEAEISPDGKTLALVIRGDIWTIPADKGGDATRLTSNGAKNFDISWSPDSSKLVFVSNQKVYYNIYTIDVKTKEVKTIAEDDTDKNNPMFSPDGKYISYLRSGKQGGLYVIKSDGTGTPLRVAKSDGNNLFDIGITDYSWSPDSKWLAFARRDPTNTWDTWIVPAAGGQEVNVTQYPQENLSPEWTSDGKYLVFFSNRDGQDDVYEVPLQRQKDDDDSSSDKSKKPEEKKPVTVTIDFQGIENRAKRITTQGTQGFQLTPDGKTVVFVSGSNYWSVPVTGGSVTKITSDNQAVGLPRFAQDSDKFWALGPNGTVRLITRSNGSIQNIAFDASMEKDLRQERLEEFNDFWRLLKVGYYDPTMHGTDWDAARKEYEPFLASVGTPEEFAIVLSEMVGTLNSSHSEISPAPGPSFPQTADLGLTFDENYPGPGLKVTDYMPKGPDDDLGPKVKPGEYVMQIDGHDVSWNESMYNYLLGKAGKDVTLLVNSKPDTTGARTVKLKAINFSKWMDLEYERIVHQNRELVNKLSDNRLAYINIRAMDQPSLKKMERELWDKYRNKEGLILDIRDNGGGSTHDDILAQLSRKEYAYTEPRDAPPSSQPYKQWSKPIVLLIDQNSASDAEIFPAGFRALKLGKIIGMPTPGYVIGTYDDKLQDGTGFRIPMWGWYLLNGEDLENRGVKPDIEVDITPKDIAEHKDSQLEAAVNYLLKELPKTK